MQKGAFTDKPYLSPMLTINLFIGKIPKVKSPITKHVLKTHTHNQIFFNIVVIP